MRLRALVGCIVVTALASSSVHATDAVLRQDAYFFTSGAKSGKSFGKKPELLVKEGRTGILAFDTMTLPPISQPSQILKASLWFYAKKVKSGGTFSVHPAANTWSEDSVTGQNQPGFTTNIFDAYSVLVGDDQSGDFIVADVTQLVQAWYSGAVQNSGWVVLADAGSGLDVEFVSREGEPANRPRLEITIGPPSTGGFIKAMSSAAGGAGTLSPTQSNFAFVPGSKAVITVNAGETVLVFASSAIGVNVGLVTANFDIGYKKVGDVAGPASTGEYQVCSFASGARTPIVLFRRITGLAPGNYEVGLTYSTTGTLTNNDWSRCLAMTISSP